MRDFIQADDVAELIGLADGAAFLRRRPRLERDTGFPRPLPTSQRPLIWSRARVTAWLSHVTSAQADRDAQIIGGPPMAVNVHLLELAARR